MTALSPEHREYLLRHAIADEVIDRSGIRSEGTRLVFPWRDGETVTEQSKDDPEQKGPYIWVRGEPLHLWAHRDCGPDSPVLMPEGTKQGLAVASWAPEGWSVYAMSGCEGASRVDLRRFAGRRVVVILDADAGENLNVYEAGTALAGRLRDRDAVVTFAQLNARGSMGVDDVMARDWDPEEREGYLQRLIDRATDKPAPGKPKSRRTRSSDQQTPPDLKGREGVAVNTDRADVIDRITSALVERAGGRSLFDFGGVITKVQGAGTVPLPKGDFLKTLTEHVACFNWKPATQSAPAVFDPAWPDGQTTEAVMSSTNASRFPPLRRVVRAPFLRPDGTVCATEGYDPTTETVLVMNGLEGTEGTGEPSQDDVRRAAKFIMEEWLGDFPFETPADRANVLAALLTPFVRGLVHLSPLCVVSGTGPGVGKNLLADNIAVLATGEAALPLPYVQDEDETRKELTAAFRTGAELFIYDEAHHIKGAHLARALTGRTWTDRVLGASTMVEYPNSVTWMSLGNQVFVEGDLYRRVYFVKIAGDDRAHDREGFEYRHADLTGWAQENRGALVGAVLTVLRGWVHAGRPAFSRGATMGSFEAWDRLMSGVCAYAGYPEFLTDSKERRSESDLFGSYWSAHLEWLHERFGGNTFTTGQVKTEALTAGDRYEAPLNLDDVTDKGYSRRLGQNYAQVQNRYFNGLKLVKAGMGHKSTIKWQIIAVSGGKEGTEGSVAPTRDVGTSSLDDVVGVFPHGGRSAQGASVPSIPPYGTNPFRS